MEVAVEPHIERQFIGRQSADYTESGVDLESFKFVGEKLEKGLHLFCRT